MEGDIFPTVSWGESDTRSYLRGLSKLEGLEERPAPKDDPLALRYLAFPRGDGMEIIATAGAEVAGETVRLWGAGTLADHRRRGAYGALVVERCRHAHALGATLALTKANAVSSAPILLRAGFRPVARERRYAFKIAILVRA